MKRYFTTILVVIGMIAAHVAPLCCVANNTTLSYSYTDIGNMVLQHENAPIKGEETLRGWFSLLHHRYQEQIVATIDRDSIRKLTILSRNQEDQTSLLAQFPTKTIFGTAYVAAKLIAVPSFTTAKSIQNITQQLMHTYDLSQLATMLDRIQQDHAACIEFLVSSQSIFTTQKSIFDSPQVINFFTSWYGKKIITAAAMLKEFADLEYKIGNNIYFQPSSILSTLPTYLMTKYFLRKSENNQPLAIFFGVIQPILSNMALRSVLARYQQNERAQEHAKISALQNGVLSLQKIVQCLFEIHTLMQSLPKQQCSDLAAAIEPIRSLLASSDTDLQLLINLLKTRVFTQKDQVHQWEKMEFELIYFLAWKCRTQLIDALHAIGVIDAHTAIARMVSQNKQSATGEKQSANFCFVDLLSQEQPLINLEQSWNPLLDPQHAVKNNIDLGQHQNTVILTGPNGTGKTVLMTSVALNALLAGSFGIAAAHAGRATPFNRIYTYLNVHGSITEHLSTFMAETKAMNDLVAAIQSAHKSDLILTIVDEPMKGTIERTGGKHVTEKVVELLQPNHLLMLATHFEQPTSLADLYPDQVVNEYLVMRQKSQMEFERSYTLVHGKHPWWFTDQTQRENFIDWLTRQ